MDQPTEYLSGFRQLTQNVRWLFLSDTFQAVSDALFTVFLTAFIWTASNSLFAVALYSLGQYVLQPLIFLVTGFLYRRCGIKAVFFLGAICVGASELAVAVFPHSTSLLLFLALGAIRSVAHGLYWPSRNYLELKEIKDGARNYFFSSLQSIYWVSGLVLPLLAGWFIAFGRSNTLYSSYEAYWIIFIFSFFLMVVSGLVVLKGNFTGPRPPYVERFTRQRLFSPRRALDFARGLTEGIGFLTSLIVLVFIGNEGVLGTLVAVASCAAAIAMYVYGRFSSPHHRSRAVIVPTVLYLAVAVMFAVFRSLPFAVVFVLCSPLAVSWISTAMEPILLAYSDQEMNGDEAARYSFIFDNEFFLNLGRSIGITIVILMAMVASSSTVLIYGPVFVSLIQLLITGLVFNHASKARV